MPYPVFANRLHTLSLFERIASFLKPIIGATAQDWPQNFNSSNSLR